MTAENAPPAEATVIYANFGAPIGPEAGEATILPFEPAEQRAARLRQRVAEQLTEMSAVSILLSPEQEQLLRGWQALVTNNDPEISRMAHRALDTATKQHTISPTLRYLLYMND